MNTDNDPSVVCVPAEKEKRSLPAQQTFPLMINSFPRNKTYCDTST